MTLKGKRLNLGGSACTVVEDDFTKGHVAVTFDDFKTDAIILRVEAAKMPYLYSRKDFR